MITQERLDTLKALYGPAPNLTLDLIAEIERLQARLSALIQFCESVQPFIDQKFVVTEIKAAVKLAKDEPLYQQKQMEE